MMTWKGKKRMSSMLLILVLLGACAQTNNLDNESGTSAQANDTLHIAVLNVGKADAIVLSTKNHAVLIDAGLKESDTVILDYLSQHNIDSLDYMILTHLDKDHIGAADSVMKNVAVKQIIQPVYVESSKQYIEYLTALDAERIVPVFLTKDMQFTLDTVEFTINPPEKDAYDLDNDYSLVISVQHGKNSFLFAGDAMTERLEELLRAENLEHAFLKVPHHGAYNEKSEEFFQAVDPKYAVITCSDKKQASDEVIALLTEAGTEVYCTKDGTVYCDSDAVSLSVWQ